MERILELKCLLSILILELSVTLNVFLDPAQLQEAPSTWNTVWLMTLELCKETSDSIPLGLSLHVCQMWMLHPMIFKSLYKLQCLPGPHLPSSLPPSFPYFPLHLRYFLLFRNGWKADVMN